jgi:hypothetical protein
MKRLCLALAVGVLLLLVTGVGTATASPPEVQDAGQLAGSDQDAGAAAGTAQEQPTNSNTSVRVLSPGDEGDVSQTNEATSNATAGNVNATEQTADQTQGGSGLQVIGQSAMNEQDAFALGLTEQEGASNENVPVRVLSEGDGGSVTQENTASSDATAGNANLTGQTADQTQSGDSCRCGSDGTQLVGQSADNDQKAAAISATEQEKPSNSNISVRVLSPGDDGDVSQTNEATSNATAGNLNATEQTAEQTQTGDSCKCGHDGTQVIGQSADSDQKAAAVSETVQEKPSNTNISVRVLSPGDDGDVTQVNEASSDATAGNANITKQDADQTQAGGSGLQTIGQSADSDQKAFAGSLTAQKGATNENVSVRVLSPGDGGSVTQTNTASSDATAGNINATKQTGSQEHTGDACKCKHGGTQLIGQSADNDQKAAALSATIQEKPSNTNTPIRVLSKGDDGDVTQTNEASSTANAGNLNATGQTADQTQTGGSCKCGRGTQLIGQSAKSDQDAAAIAATFQVKPSNTNSPVRVLSKGDSGDVTQTNEASSTANAGNLNATWQTADQSQSGAWCKCWRGAQLIGQSAQSDQDAEAISATFQVEPSNTNEPFRVLSKGDDGDVSQTNEATSTATAGNLNATKQAATQAQGGSGLQIIGQAAKNEQDAFALGLTFQVGASNENAPVRVLSKGDGGSVSQSNIASSDAVAGNLNWTDQNAAQTQGGTRGCCGTGIQAVGQLAKNDQSAVALSLTAQLGHKQPCVCGEKGSIGNSNEPIRVKSPGDDGPVRQSNVATSSAVASNWNAAKQHVQEIQAAPCLCKEPGIQAVGQLDDSKQFAVAGAASLQLVPRNTWAPERKESRGHTGGLTQLGKKNVHDLSGSRSLTDQSSQRIKR